MLLPAHCELNRLGCEQIEVAISIGKPGELASGES